MSIGRAAPNERDAVEAARTHHPVNNHREVNDESNDRKEPEGNHKDAFRRIFCVHRQNEESLVKENTHEDIQRAI